MRNIVFHDKTKTFHLYNEKNKLHYVRVGKRTHGADLFWKENS